MARHHAASTSKRGRRSAIASAATSVTSSVESSRAASPSPPLPPFRFFDLPSELRLRVYELLLLTSKPLDLDPANHRLIRPRLALFLVSRRMHAEAYRVFYAQPLRLFPSHDRFFYTAKPLLARLPPRYRAVVPAAELRLGPGWTAPPRCQNAGDAALGLSDCASLRTLRVFVELDPSDTVFAGFRGPHATEFTYITFCVRLLRGLLARAPRVDTVEIDAFPSVQRGAPLVVALRRVVVDEGKRLAWGPMRGWDDDGGDEEPALAGLGADLAGLTVADALSSPPRPPPQPLSERWEADVDVLGVAVH